MTGRPNQEKPARAISPEGQIAPKGCASRMDRSAPHVRFLLAPQRGRSSPKNGLHDRDTPPSTGWGLDNRPRWLANARDLGGVSMITHSAITGRSQVGNGTRCSFCAGRCRQLISAHRMKSLRDVVNSVRLLAGPAARNVVARKTAMPAQSSATLGSPRPYAVALESHVQGADLGSRREHERNHSCPCAVLSSSF